MIPLFEAAWEIHQFLTKQKIPYAIIGGLAVQHWGVPRLTDDVDVEILAPLMEGSERYVKLFLAQFALRDKQDPLVRAKRDRVILISATNGRGIDISFGVPGYQDEFFRRAVNFKLARGKIARVCSAEDLIIHKCVAGREKDLRDIAGVIAQHRAVIQVGYIRNWLQLFDELLPEPHALADFEHAWRAEQRAMRETRQVYRVVSRSRKRR